MNNVNPLEHTLFQYYNLCQEAKKSKTVKSHQPILFIETVNGQKKIKVLDDRSKLPFIQRLLAYFGFGSASLSSVRIFLQTRKFSELNLIEQNHDLIFQCFQAINEKIQSRNTSHWIQKINCISLPTQVQYAESEASTTYHPSNSTPKQDKKGVLDFACVFPKLGTAYIGDGTSHGKPDKRKILKELWQEFNKTFIKAYEDSQLFESQLQVEAFLRQNTLDLSKKFEDKGIASTFSLSMLIEINGKKQVASIHAGDSTLLHVKTDGTVHRITPTDSPANQSELSSLSSTRIHFDIREVQSGDKIIGVTDGITDFLPEEKLHTILRDHQLGKGLLDELKIAISVIAEDDQEYPGIKKLNQVDKNNSDDVSAFMMVVS